jgi:hypothetical protein
MTARFNPLRPDLGLFLFRLLGFAVSALMSIARTSSHRRAVWHELASDNRRSEDVLILPIIIAELELRNIDWSVFGVHLAEN